LKKLGKDVEKEIGAEALCDLRKIMSKKTGMLQKYNSSRQPAVRKHKVDIASSGNSSVNTSLVTTSRADKTIEFGKRKQSQ